MIARLGHLLAAAIVVWTLASTSLPEPAVYMLALLGAAILWLRIEHSDPTRRNVDAARNQPD